MHLVSLPDVQLLHIRCSEGLSHIYLAGTERVKQQTVDEGEVRIAGLGLDALYIPCSLVHLLCGGVRSLHLATGVDDGMHLVLNLLMAVGAWHMKFNLSHENATAACHLQDAPCLSR